MRRLFEGCAAARRGSVVWLRGKAYFFIGWLRGEEYDGGAVAVARNERGCLVAVEGLQFKRKNIYCERRLSLEERRRYAAQDGMARADVAAGKMA